MIAVRTGHVVSTVCHISRVVLRNVAIIATSVGHLMRNTIGIAIPHIIARNVVDAHFCVRWAGMLEELAIG